MEHFLHTPGAYARRHTEVIPPQTTPARRTDLSPVSRRVGSAVGLLRSATTSVTSAVGGAIGGAFGLLRGYTADLLAPYEHSGVDENAIYNEPYVERLPKRRRLSVDVLPEPVQAQRESRLPPKYLEPVMSSSDVDAFVAKHCSNALVQRAIEKTTTTDRLQNKLQLHKPPKDLTSDLPRSVEYVPLFKPRSQQRAVAESTNIRPVMESDLFPTCAPPKFPPTTPGADDVSPIEPPSGEVPQPCSTGLRFSQKSEALFVFGKGDGVKVAVSTSKPLFTVPREKGDPPPDAQPTTTEEVPWWLKNKDKPCLVPVEDAEFADNGCETDSEAAPSIEPETVVEEVPWWLKNKDKPCLVPVEDAEFADNGFEDDRSDTTLAGNIFGQISGNQGSLLELHLLACLEPELPPLEALELQLRLEPPLATSLELQLPHPAVSSERPAQGSLLELHLLACLEPELPPLEALELQLRLEPPLATSLELQLPHPAVSSEHPAQRTPSELHLVPCLELELPPLEALELLLRLEPHRATSLELQLPHPTVSLEHPAQGTPLDLHLLAYLGPELPPLEALELLLRLEPRLATSLELQLPHPAVSSEHPAQGTLLNLHLVACLEPELHLAVSSEHPAQGTLLDLHLVACLELELPLLEALELLLRLEPPLATSLELQLLHPAVSSEHPAQGTLLDLHLVACLELELPLLEALELLLRLEPPLATSLELQLLHPAVSSEHPAQGTLLDLHLVACLEPEQHRLEVSSEPPTQGTLLELLPVACLELELFPPFKDRALLSR
ncbi:MAG: uncharacterized protein KVP18_005227 [Porospora cf. gigantea A]|uniref:uncharacterized protein n=1 Tax=Porospora cf. gigantea A TaxID=2853593 RepID=UPI00355A69C1|nr:MAG: hypothetical protein KVP18_005227 [Porospora cf. gigantea A]